MNLVAKPYQKYKQVGDTFTKNGKNYITIETKEGLKEVRLYTLEEYNFLLGMQAKKDELEKKRRLVAQSYDNERKVNAGFKEGYIVAVLGDTFKYKEQLKEKGAKYSSQFKWYFEGGSEPKCISSSKKLLGFPVKYVKWEEVSHMIDTGATVLKPTNEIEKLLKIDTPIKEPYEFQGAIGAMIERRVVVTSTKVVDGCYGRHVMNIMEDSAGQIYVYNSSVSNMFKIGRIFHFEAKIINHNVFEGIRQTIIDELVLDRDVCGASLSSI